MSKDNVLFSIIGLLLGLIIGFLVTNSINQSGGGATRSQTTKATTQASELPPDHPAVPSNGVADQPSQMAPAAVTEAIQKARNEPNNFEAQMEAAELYYKIRRYDEAIELLLHANQLRPDSYEAVVALGNTYFDAEKYKEAEQWYMAALIKKPDDINVRTDLGLTFLFREPPDIDRAIKDFRKSLELDPRHEQTLQNITVALTRKGDAREAKAMLARLEEVNPQSPALTKLRSDLEQLSSSSKSSPPDTSKKSRK
ncbi:MAG TPA: tetratricopeptide repeat protein [Pyrinomonadaceae bacterium]|jgi:tetratricopeptide (TPR) repeat protein